MAGRQGCISGGGGLAGKASQEMDSEHLEKDNAHQGSPSRESSMKSGVVCYPREILVSRDCGRWEDWAEFFRALFINQTCINPIGLYLGNHRACSVQGSSPCSQLCRPP